MKSKILAIIFLLCLSGCIISSQISTVEDDIPKCDRCENRDFPHGFTDLPVYTGRWEFVTLEGQVISGYWRHQKLLVDSHIDFEVPNMIERKALTGVLYAWWDWQKSKVYTISEYRNGNGNGYDCQLTYRGQFWRISTMRNGKYETVSFFRDNGYYDITMSLDARGQINKTLYFPEKGEKRPDYMWPPYPADGSPLISTVTNNIFGTGN